MYQKAPQNVLPPKMYQKSPAKYQKNTQNVPKNRLQNSQNVPKKLPLGVFWYILGGFLVHFSRGGFWYKVGSSLVFTTPFGEVGLSFQRGGFIRAKGSPPQGGGSIGSFFWGGITPLG